MRSLAVLALVSCGSITAPPDAGTIDASQDARVDAIDASKDAGLCGLALCVKLRPECVPFPAFDDRCTTSGDCASARHRLDCCGSEIVSGIASSAKAQFDLAEKQWNAGCSLCGCMPMPTVTTSGDVCIAGYALVAVDCTITDGGVGRCVTRCADGWSSDASDE